MLADAEDHDLDVSEKGKDHVKAQTLRKKSEDLAGEILDLSWVGIIIGLQDGDIEVHWANGLVSKVSDGFHTFLPLYEPPFLKLNILFLLLLLLLQLLLWWWWY